MLGRSLFVRYVFDPTYYVLLPKWKSQVNLDNILTLKNNQINLLCQKNAKYIKFYNLYLLSLARSYFLKNFCYEEKFLNKIIKIADEYSLNLYLYEHEILLQFEGVVFEFNRGLKSLDVKFTKFNHEFTYFRVAKCSLFSYDSKYLKLISSGDLYISNLSIILVDNHCEIRRLDWGFIKSIEVHNWGILLRFTNNFSFVLRSDFNFYVLIIDIYRAINRYHLRKINFKCSRELLPI